MFFPRLVLAEEVRRLIMLSISLSGIKNGFILGLLFAGVSTFAEFEGKKLKWKGYTKTEFKVGEYAAFVVEPKTHYVKENRGFGGPVSPLIIQRLMNCSSPMDITLPTSILVLSSVAQRLWQFGKSFMICLPLNTD